MLMCVYLLVGPHDRWLRGRRCNTKQIMEHIAQRQLGAASGAVVDAKSERERLALQHHAGHVLYHLAIEAAAALHTRAFALSSLSPRC